MFEKKTERNEPEIVGRSTYRGSLRQTLFGPLSATATSSY